MSKQAYSSAAASVAVRKSKQRTKALIAALIGRELGYPEAMKVKRDLAASGILPKPERMLPGEPLREQSRASKAREAGLHPSTFYARVHDGWTEEQALSVPFGAGRANSLAVKARAVGLPPDMVRRRVREGMTEEQALSAPVVEYNRRLTASK
jgi:hypothetical protein